MVRLQLVGLRVTVSSLMNFQSHYGAIATEHFKDTLLSIFTFNPTMVRLQP